MNKRLLLLSNSTNPGEPYLGWPAKHIKDFLGEKTKKVLFIPYAGVTITHDDYFHAVSTQFEALGYKMDSAHNMANPQKVLSEYDAITVGGGNTFQLIRLLEDKGLIPAIQNAVLNGMPYIGWSAGSNIASPTIKTTNDMPIVEPASFNAFNFIPFQINPHYTEATLPNHGGESRDVRINEFVTVNQSTNVVCLPEGSLLRYENEQIFFTGKGPCKVFRYAQPIKTFKDGDDLSWLLDEGSQIS